MKKILTEKLNALKELCKAYHVDKLYVFGSVCTDKFNEKSDIDFLVSFQPMDYGDYADNYFKLADKLEELFKRKIDLTTVNSLSNPYFIKSLEKTKTALYA
ncbi:MAG: nucleotidyltransferase domain-containing protein [Bacteroidales bacterium]|nr:nucleotidyltransferase domain-containing protein [Bacteroidales bacterium]MQY78474.1 nucleotidyltransferase domain-containing protein [Bacteroidota bacterium]